MKNRKSFKSLVILSSTVVLGLGANHLTAQTQTDKDKAQAETTLRQMWKAVGTADFPALKSTLNFPCAFMEITSKDAGTVFSVDKPSYFDRDEKFSKDTKAKGKNADFAGAVISDVKVEMLNAGVANVTYKFFLPERKIGGSVRNQETLNLVAVLKKNGKDWKIVFTGIPM